MRFSFFVVCVFAGLLRPLSFIFRRVIEALRRVFSARFLLKTKQRSNTRTFCLSEFNIHTSTTLVSATPLSSLINTKKLREN